LEGLGHKVGCQGKVFLEEWEHLEDYKKETVFLEALEYRVVGYEEKEHLEDYKLEKVFLEEWEHLEDYKKEKVFLEV